MLRTRTPRSSNDSHKTALHLHAASVVRGCPDVELDPRAVRITETEILEDLLYPDARPGRWPIDSSRTGRGTAR